MRKIILTDIDHTISSAFWRDGMLGSPKVDWEAYHAAAPGDEPIADTVRMLQMLALLEHEIVGLTARPARFRKLTMDWLIKHSVPMHELLMRADDDYRPSAVMKPAMALERFPNAKDEVAFILEDRDDVVAAFRGLGITALQVFARQD